MFDWRYSYDSDYGWETVDNYEACSLEEALESIRGFENDATIETEIVGTVVFEDGEWLMSREEAEKIATEEEAARKAEKEKKEAAIAAEKSTFGDDIDKANIAFIMSVAEKYPAKDNGAERTAKEIGQKEEWKNKYRSFRPTESDVIHVPSGREYHIDMWKGMRKITRTQLLR